MNDDRELSLASWLRCPACGKPLRELLPLTIGCDTGHRYDVNKRGYVTLLPSGSKLVGDTGAMLDARDVVLESGAFEPITAAVANASEGSRVVDAGAGTGHYLRAVLAAHAGSRGLAMDLSPPAVARAVRSSPSISGLVADSWSPLPVRTAVADTVLNVFAPRNLPEFARVLRGEGILVVVVPRQDHLGELRQSTEMLGIPADKADEVVGVAERLFMLTASTHVTYTLRLEPGVAQALVGMGPSARHVAAATTFAPSHTTVSVDVLRFRRK